jgi:hypothetical protein
VSAAVLVGVAVAVRAPLSGTWPAAAVTAWALVTVAGLGVLVSTTAHLVESALVGEALLVSAAGTPCWQRRVPVWPSGS